MEGRLGNQFFRYAFARQLQEYNPTETVIYNFDGLLRHHQHDGDGFENSLRWFCTKGSELQDAVNYSIPQYIVKKIYNRFYPRGKSFLTRNKYERKWLPLLKVFGLYFLSLGYTSFPLKKPWWIKSLIVDGSFECVHYFEEIDDKIRAEFQPKEPSLKVNHQLLKVISKTESVAISIRRGDFVDDINVRGVYNVCNKSYYYRAINEIKRRVKNPVFVFFSNDISWVKENIQIDDYSCYYESGDDPVWETMRLMSSCKHFVISNSTFHWWAQYLCTNPNKVVIAPSRWYNDKFVSSLYQKNWTLIDP